MPESSSDLLKEQQFLSLFMDIFARGNNPRPSQSEDIPEQDVEGPDPASAERMNDNLMEDLESTGGEVTSDGIHVDVAAGTTVYDNFVSVLTTSPGELLNRIVSQPDLDKLFKLKPYKLAAIMPKIRIFKVIYPNGGGPEEQGENLEYIFKRHYDAADVRTMISDRSGRGQGVGLKSFEWKLLGTNTAEVDNNIKATMKILFQNWKDFANDDIIADMMAAAADPDRDRGEALPHAQANFMDLIFRPARNPPSDAYDSKYYRIKVIAGWTVDPALVGSGPGKMFTTAEADLINNTGTVLLLNLLQHDIDFREDGTIELTLEYHAAVETMLSSRNSNILYVPVRRGTAVDENGNKIHGEGSSLAATLRELELREESLVQDEQRLQQQQSYEQSEGTEGYTRPESDGLGCAFEPYDGDAAALETSLEAVQARLTETRESIRRQRNQVYSRILTAMIDPSAAGITNTRHTRRRGVRMRYANIPISWWSRGAPELSLSSGAWENFEAAVLGGERIFIGESAAARGQVGAAAAGITNPEGGAAAEGTDATASAFRKIHYFYFGDLLDIVMELLQLTDNPDHREVANIRMVLGSLAVPMGHRNRSSSEPQSTIVNIADIPVSLNLFLNFFNDRIVGRERRVWLLRDFIKEVFSGLIYPCLPDRVAGITNRRIYRNDITISNVTAYGNSDGDDRLMTGRGNVSIEGTDIGPEQFGYRRMFDEDIAQPLTGRLLQDQALYHYIVVQASDHAIAQDATSDDAPERDAARGTYWLNIGNDKGLVKEIKFKKTDQPGLPEARQEREGSIGLGQLRDKYDADVTLVGNAIFQPGQIIYLNPSVIGLGGVVGNTQLSSVLGIGGYHQIITVDNAISDNNYETILNTKWVASGVPVIDANVESDESQDCSGTKDVVETDGVVETGGATEEEIDARDRWARELSATQTETQEGRDRGATAKMIQQWERDVDEF